jgi:hypothetical protein
MTDTEERKRIYSETRRDLLARQLSNAENFDKAILSLSTAGLGFSLAFIKDIIPLSRAGFLDLIYYSWYLFGGAIVVTLLSFHSSQIGIDKQLILAERYYLKCDEKALRTTGWAKLTVWLNRLSGIFFIAAIFLTIVFVTLNVRR